MVHPFMSDITIGHIALGVTMQFVMLISHHSNALFRGILLIVLVTKFTAVLHAGTVFS
jgi:hypothetical protein